MSDVSGTNPDPPITPEEPEIAPADVVIPADPDAPVTSEEPEIAPADIVIPPPPPEIPIPEGLLNPPPSEIPVADAVIPPPPPETLRRSDRPRPTPAILEGDQPAAAADDWSQPSVAPEVPTSGGYRGLTVAIFAFLFALLVVAIVLLAYLLGTGRYPFFVFDDAAALTAVLTPLF